MTVKQIKRLQEHCKSLSEIMEELGTNELSFEVGEDENFTPVFLVYTAKKRFIVRCGKKEKVPESHDIVLKALDNIQHELGNRYGK